MGMNRWVALVFSGLAFAAAGADIPGDWCDAVVFGEKLDMRAPELAGYLIREIPFKGSERAMAKEAERAFDGFATRLVLVSHPSLDARAVGKVVAAVQAKQPTATVLHLKGDLLAALREHVGVAHKVAFPKGADHGFVCEPWADTTARPFAVMSSVRVRKTGGVQLSLRLCGQFMDGTYTWWHTWPFDGTKTNVWQRGRVMYRPTRAIRADYVVLGAPASDTCEVEYGDTWVLVYRPETRPTLDAWPTDAAAFGKHAGFYFRDVARGGGYRPAEDGACGLGFSAETEQSGAARVVSAKVVDRSGADRALSLVYAIPLPQGDVTWWSDPRTSRAVSASDEEQRIVRLSGAGAGELSIWPLGAVAADGRGVVVAIDPETPVHYRIGLSPKLRMLYFACDLGLAPERPAADIRFAVFPFKAADGFRGAYDQYMKLYPEAFKPRIPKHGGWFAFGKMSEVPDVGDFGIQFKQVDNETEWDDAHGVYTFRYYEPGTWWMDIGGREGRKFPTYSESLAHARTLLERGNVWAKAWDKCGFLAADGRRMCEPCDRHWCHGAVWSMNSAPGIEGGEYSFKQAEKDYEKNYAEPFPKGLDGEYVDSAHMWMTAPLDYDRGHFAAMRTPLVYDPQTRRVAIFKGLVCQEYCAETAKRLRKRGRFLFANTDVERWSWLVPQLDVVGTEVNFFTTGEWKALGHPDLLFRRAICAKKPFIMFQTFDPKNYTQEMAERYFRLALAYGMFPSFEPILFKHPDIRDRDRPLFRKYMPLCRELSEAGWRPLNALAACDDSEILVEQFGDRFLTVFNSGKSEASVRLRPLGAGNAAPVVRERLTGRTLALDGSPAALGAGEVMMLEFAGAGGR